MSNNQTVIITEPAAVMELFKTKELCLAAVKKNGMALQHVPEELKILGLCH